MTHASLIRGFSFGEVVGGAFSVLFRNLILFLLIAMVVSAPVAFYPLYIAPPRTQSGVAPYQIGQLVLQLVSTTLSIAMLVYGTVQTLRGRSASVGGTVSFGLSVLFPALGVTIVIAIAIGLAAIVASIPLFIIPTPWLMIIPAVVVLILLVRWWVSIPALVVERQGVFASIGRSTELTRGYRWPIFGIIVLLVVAQVVVGLILGATLVPSVMRGGMDPVVYLCIEWVVTSFFSALSGALAGVAYFALRVQQEGVDLEEVASVFD